MLPRFEAAEPRYHVPGGWRVESGYLTVPEARSAASGWRGDEHVVRLYVSIVRSSNPHPRPDPVVLLSGGPGSSCRDMLESEALGAVDSKGNSNVALIGVSSALRFNIGYSTMW